MFILNINIENNLGHYSWKTTKKSHLPHLLASVVFNGELMSYSVIPVGVIASSACVSHSPKGAIN